MRKTISICGSGPRRSLLFLGTNDFHSRIQEIEKEIGGTWLEIVHLEARLELAGRMGDPEETQAERDDSGPSQSGRPTIMVFKLGCSSELTIGCLYNICSVRRTAFKTYFMLTFSSCFPLKTPSTF